jgi:hypothetical protein
MPFASTSAVQLAYTPEATFGVTPTTGNHRNLRMTSESLAFDVTKEKSKEINPSRTVSSVAVVGASTTGGFQAEMQYAEYDALMAATLRSNFTAYGTNGVGTSFTADFTATTITAAVAPTGSSAFTTLQRGQWFRVSAGANANNGKLLRVSTVTAPTSTVITLDASTPAVVSAAVAVVALQSSRLTHGDTSTSFTLERQMTDVAEFFAFRGMTPSKMDIGLSTEALSTISFDFMGKDAVRNATSTNLPGTATASYNYDIHSGASNTASCQIWVGDTPLAGTFASSLTLSFDNSLREIKGLCNLGAVGTGSGQIVCTLQAEMFFSSGALFDQFRNNVNQPVIFSSLDADGNGYVFTLPKANITSYSAPAGGQDAEVMVSVTFDALRDEGAAAAALRRALFIDRVGVAAV